MEGETIESSSAVRFCPGSRPRFSAFVLAAVGMIALVVSCASQKTAGSDPDDMSVEEHREAAEKEEEKAEKHREQYDPSAKETKRRAQAGNPEAGIEYTTTEYNPTTQHLEEAKTYEEHAKQHEQAAQTLLEFENEQCAKFPEKTRAQCPLMGQVRAVEEVDGGAKLMIAEGVALDAIADHMRCHFAFARTEGYEGMETCPLYLNDLTIEPVESDHAVIIRTSDSSNVDGVRQRSRDHVE